MVNLYPLCSENYYFQDMRNVIVTILLFLSFPGLSQERSPDYIQFNYELYETFIEQDSVREIEHSFYNYKILLDTIYYKNKKEFLRKNKRSKHLPISTQELDKIPNFKPDDVIYFKTDHNPRWHQTDYFFQIIDDSYYMSVWPEDSITDRYSSFFNGSLERYQKLERPTYDLILFHDGVGVDVLYRNKKSGYKIVALRNELFNAEYPYKGLSTFNDHRKKANANPLIYCCDKGFETYISDTGMGVFDLVKNRPLLEAVYKNIILDTYISVEGEKGYGVYDYIGNLIVPLENKKVDYYGTSILYINQSTKLKAIYKDGRHLEASDSLYSNFRPPTKNNDSLARLPSKYDPWRWRIFKDSTGGFGVKAQHIPSSDNGEYVGFTKHIQNSKVYEKMFFPGNLNYTGEMAQGDLLFGKRTDDTYDVLATYPNPKDSVMVKGVTKIEYRHEVIPRNSGLHPVFTIFEKDGKKSIWNFWDKTFDFRYKEIEYRFMGYYRFVMHDGRKGWVDWRGDQEFFDPE